MFQGFDTVQVTLGSATIYARVGGLGAPLLLLHGYPQTHAMWHEIAAELAKSHRVVVPDLRGYGRSTASDRDFTFRAMARDQVALMAHLGHDSFHLISHDRGARTAHRMVLDHPDLVQSIAIFDILPTLDVWRLMDDWLALRYYHWAFLAQPDGIPQRMINADPIAFLHSALSGLSGSDGIFHPEAMADYERAARNPDVVDAWCGDYRTAARVDRDHDLENLGQTSEISCLVLWGARGVVDHHVDPVEAWRKWFPNAEGHIVDAGHFLVEERPREVLEKVKAHLDQVG